MTWSPVWVLSSLGGLGRQQLAGRTWRGAQCPFQMGLEPPPQPGMLHLTLLSRGSPLWPLESLGLAWLTNDAQVPGSGESSGMCEGADERV